jgi:hypothetical protein
MVYINQIKVNANGTTFREGYVVGEDEDEIIKQMRSRIRPQSFDFYARELRRELKVEGQSVVDRHAGNGVSYTVFLGDDHEPLFQVADGIPDTLRSFRYDVHAGTAAKMKAMEVGDVIESDGRAIRRVA